MKIKLIVPAVLAGCLVGGAVLVSPVNAGWWAGSDELASQIAQRFSLNESEVKTFLTEKRQVAKTIQHKKTEERLGQLVKDGKLTDAQKAAILAKLDEVSDKISNWQDLTVEDRKAQMKTLRDDLKKWAEENKIPARWGWIKWHRSGWWK